MTGRASVGPQELADFLAALRQRTHLTFTEACRNIGTPAATVRYWLDVLLPRYANERPDLDFTVPAMKGVRRSTVETSTPVLAPAVTAPAAVSVDNLVAMLKRGPRTLSQIAEALRCSPGAALDGCFALQAAGKTVSQEGDTWFFHDAPEPAFVAGSSAHILLSDDRHVFRMGVVADSHLGSKYERMDALNDIYDRFVTEGITHVYHCGNWIEGEARFNRTDVSVHGMDNQLDYLARAYPQRPGITTYAVAGDDHEGWYGQREGLDIGKHAEKTMRAAGRTDWVNLGYMEAHVLLRNRQSGKDAVMAVVHPGGGSSYAESYVVQKIIESLDGGEKPALALYGHYHKAIAGEYRNVFWMLVPSTKDQDVFMRKKRLRSVVGGAIIEVSQHPEDGALHSYKPWIWRYFNKGYYNDRWNHGGDVVLPERKAA